MAEILYYHTLNNEKFLIQFQFYAKYAIAERSTTVHNLRK